MVGIYAGNQQVKQISYGSTAINQVYHGSTLVWSALPPGTVMAESSTGNETGSFTVEVPGTYRLTVVGGGGGAAVNNSSQSASGGGGGTAIADFVLAAGDVISWKVGKKGADSTTWAGTGGESYIKKGDTTLVSANGGGGGVINTSKGGSGGTASIDAAGTNTTNQTGGNGVYKTGASSAATAPAAGTSYYGTYGKGESAYFISYNNPGFIVGSAGYIKVIYV